MRARTFFLVCAGILCLALAYHLGARSAGAQATGTAEAVSFSYGSAWAALDRYLYRIGTDNQVYRYSEPVPGTSPIIAVGGDGVVLADGSVYTWFGNPDDWWRYRGTFPFGATSTAPSTWGRVKTRWGDRAAPRAGRLQTHRERRALN